LPIDIIPIWHYSVIVLLTSLEVEMFYYCPTCGKHYHLYSVIGSHYHDTYHCPDCGQPVIRIDRVFVPADIRQEYDRIENSFGG